LPGSDGDTAAVAGICLWGWTWGWGGGWGCTAGWNTYADYGPVHVGAGTGLVGDVAPYCTDVVQCYDGDAVGYDMGAGCDGAGFEICDAGAVDAVSSAFDVGFFF